VQFIFVDFQISRRDSKGKPLNASQLSLDGTWRGVVSFLLAKACTSPSSLLNAMSLTKTCDTEARKDSSRERERDTNKSAHTHYRCVGITKLAETSPERERERERERGVAR